MTQSDLDDIFTYRAPFGTQADKYTALTVQGKLMARVIMALTPASPEQTIAVRKLQEAIMFANAAIAVNEKGE